MKYCEACKTNIDNPLNYCPLCYSSLISKDSTAEVSSYPDVTGNVEQYNLFFRILVFISITACVVSVTVDMLTATKYPWSMAVVASIAYVWAAVGTAIRRHRKVGFNMMMQVISFSILSIILGNLLNFSYIVYNYILPALFVSAMLSFNILAIVKRGEISNLVLYSLIVSVFGFIPIILYLTGLSTVLWAVVTSAVYSVISIISMFIFADRVTKTELRKRFHI